MHPDIAGLLASYPRQRLPLSPAHDKIFAEQYKLNRDGAKPVEALAQRMERWMHRQVASQAGASILELGAGTLNHLRFEQPDVIYDIVEPFESLFQGHPELARIRGIYSSVKEIEQDQRYNRCISIAVLEHMEDLPGDLAYAAQLLEEDGVFQAGIPSEGGFLWGMAWRGTTGISYRLRTGLDYGTVMRHEHVNTASEITAIVRYIFKDVKLKRFPFPGLHFSFYTYLEAKSPDMARVKAILATRVT